MSKRHDDVRNASVPSKLCHFKRHESAGARHQRRFDTANSASSLSQLRGFCEQRGFKLRVLNRGEHFIIQAGRDQVAQWWPRTAKLIIRHQWQAGIHCHDVRQLMHEICVASGAETFEG